MDKQWMSEPRYSQEYIHGVESFIEFACTNSAKGNEILCPCKKCGNGAWRAAKVVYKHLICEGFLEGYTRWVFHGEHSAPIELNAELEPNIEIGQQLDDEITQMLHDMGHCYENGGEDVSADYNIENPNEDPETFYKLADDASQMLYPGCKFTKLHFIVRLLHTKFLGGWTNNSFDNLLELLKEAFPVGTTLPKNFHGAKKMVSSLGLGYENIEACKNDCVLFWKENAKLDACPKCKTSRWKMEKRSLDGKRIHRVPYKVLRYFPLQKRLQRLYMSAKTATNMRYHSEGRPRDGFMRHPADSKVWKDFDNKYPDFSSDCRNVRLALATDGLNPFRNFSSTHSTWPIIVIPLNLPPWMCMKQPNFILSLLIPGPKSPGKDIDVYLQHLVDEMLLGWHEGFRTYDAATDEWFQMRIILLWTVSDYPGLGYVSGQATSGMFGCVPCHIGTCSVHLKNGHKQCYMGHRRFLHPNHEFRNDSKSFDGTKEFREAPVPLSGHDVFEQTKTIVNNFGKDPAGKKPLRNNKADDGAKVIWNKQPIWLQLPYWKDILLRHNLDVMHIEKNVCDNIINTLLDIDKKSKDNLNSRLDLQALGIRKDLHPVSVGDKFYLPPACYTMTSNEKKLFCEVLKSVKFPDGYAADIRSHVNVDEKKIVGLKSHDSHVLLQNLLPLAIRRVLPENVSVALIRVSNFFKKIFSPIISVADMDSLEPEIAETLCLLEKIFPPSFFDVMVHLMVHLPAEARLAGPVQYRNMYPIERFWLRLKGYVRTRSHPEGSIAENYVFDESMTFCSRYLNCETRFSRRGRNYGDTCNDLSNGTSYLKTVGRGLVGKCAVTLDHRTWLQAHRYVLFNYEYIEPYLTYVI